MHKDPKEAKENIVQAISVLRSVNDKRPNSYLLRTFFDAKSNEIQTIFSDGPSVDIAQLIDNLNRIAPTKRKIGRASCRERKKKTEEDGNKKRRKSRRK